MINSIQQAIQIQARRLEHQRYCRINDLPVSKSNMPKAIRRYLLREHPDVYQWTKTKIMREAWQNIQEVESEVQS